MASNTSYRVQRNYFLAWILILITCQFCSKDFVRLGRHLWRCRERNHHDNGSNDARSSYQRSIVSVGQTDLQSLRTPTNSKIQCPCGKEVNSHAGRLKRHQRSCRVIMGLNDKLNYALQKDNEKISGDHSESTVNVNLAEDTIVKPGIKLPKSESEWKTANSFFQANLPTEDMNTSDGDFNDIATNFGKTVYDSVSKINMGLYVKTK